MADAAPTHSANASSRRRSWSRWIGLALVLLLAGAPWLVYAAWFKTYHLATVQPGVLYRDGNASIRGFDRAIEQTKPRTVVMLIDQGELNDPRKPQFKQEIEHLAARGIAFEWIPIPLGGWPKSADVRRFLSVTRQPENQPVLVHCAQGVRRTGMMSAAFQMSQQGLDREKAKAAILTFGHSERTVADVKKFIDIFDPARLEVTATLPATGQE